jgi:Zn-dependent alcohol dehydrogenase
MKTWATVLRQALGDWNVEEVELDELVTRVYSLNEINIAYHDSRNGRNIRGVIHLAKQP